MTAREGALVVFGKSPRTGAVKTRLAGALGGPATRALYAAFLADTLERAARVADRVAARALLFLADPGADAEDLGLELPEGLEVRRQRGDNLGTRMAAAVEDAGGQRIVLIGSDSPAMPERRLVDAFAACDAGRFVLGPVLDGGYDLVGLPRPVPELFADIPWSTAHVFEMTRRRAEGLGLPVAILDVGYDVDRPEDLDRLAADPHLAFAPRTQAALGRRGGTRPGD